MTAPDFTIADVLAWARTKPADEAYDYNDPYDCALCQFLKETGRAVQPALANNDWYESGNPKVVHYFDPALAAAADCARGTFGNFVAELEALLPAEPISDTWIKADAYLTDIVKEPTNA